MQRFMRLSLVVALFVVGYGTLIRGSRVAAQDASPVASPATAGVEVLAGGLTNPRGFTWGEDGTLYLALAGTGGSDQVVVEATPYPYFVGNTASIVTVADGCPEPFAESLPSLFWSEPGWTWGIMDLVFLDGELYALSGGGSSPDAPNGVYRVAMDGSWELVADLGTWATENPTEFIPPDYDPAGSWFDMEAGEDGRLWLSEAVGGRLLTVTPADGSIALIADLSEMKLTPTGIAVASEGGAYLGFETTVPFVDGTSKVVHVAEDGTVTDVWTGLTAVTDIAIGPDGMLYAAEMATGNLDDPPYLNPNSGRIVRQTGADSLEEVATDIPYPVTLGFDDAGSLLIAYPAFGPDNGEDQGALVRVDLAAGVPISLAGVDPTASTCAT